MKKKPPTKKGTYHYHFLYDECVLCGQTYTSKWRVTGKRHSDRSICVQFKQHACDAHFM